MTTAIALLAGGPPGTAVRLGSAMLAIQLSIGAFNDLNDAEADARSKPGKPIPAGTTGRGDAQLLTVAGLVIGLALSWPSGPIVTAIALAGGACGYLYDAGLKRTALSWLPLAIALPLLPAFAWLGASASAEAPFGRGGLPPGAGILVPLAILAGGALAISNALIDLEADRAAGLSTVVARLGRERSWWLHATLLVAVIVVAAGAVGAWWGTPAGAAGSGATGLVGGVAFLVGAGLMALGAGLTWRRTRPSGPAATDRAGWLTRLAWEMEAVGVGLLG
ncbi:MAG TPA: UbiA family prenyltransferase, partial [Candidatus Polarisedimenticolia bacterium]|nr:UbiA family prenyltransferase [Candidatus Polarisedimenticolia bacterium]